MKIRGLPAGLHVLEADGLHDAIRAFLIFLNLLKGYSKALAKLLLAHSEHVAAQSYPASNVNIDRVWFLLVLCHFSLAALHGRLVLFPPTSLLFRHKAPIFMPERANPRLAIDNVNTLQHLSIHARSPE